MKIENFIRPNIIQMEAYASARSEYKGQAEIFLDANESPFSSDVNRYPDPLQKEVLNLLAKQKGIHPKNIALGNGSDELIDQIIRICCTPGTDKIITCKPGFSMFGVAAQMNDVGVIELPLKDNFQLDVNEILKAIQPNIKIIFICSPNNPTGNLMRREDVEELLSEFKGLLVLDEAYIDFASEKSMLDLIKVYPNLLVLQTFSKARGMAGIRLGMAFANEDIIHYINKIRMPYNVNRLTASRALEQLSDPNFLDSIQYLMEQRAQLANELIGIPFVEKIFPSDANFLLVRFKQKEKVFTYLKENGIIVRDRSKQYACENCLRITIGTKEENERLLETLKQLR